MILEGTRFLFALLLLLLPLSIAASEQNPLKSRLRLFADSEAIFVILANRHADEIEIPHPFFIAPSNTLAPVYLQVFRTEAALHEIPSEEKMNFGISEPVLLKPGDLVGRSISISRVCEWVDVHNSRIYVRAAPGFEYPGAVQASDLVLVNC